MISVWLSAWTMLAAPVSEPAAAPDPADYELHWQAPPGCPDAASIADRIARLLPGPGTGVGTMTVSASVSSEPGGYRLSLATEFLGLSDAREVTADACAELGETTALLVAMALEPARAESLPPPAESVTFVEAESAVAIPPPPEVAQLAAAPTPSGSVSVVEPEPEPKPQPQPQPAPARITFTVRAGLGASIGTLPSPTGTSLVAVGLAWPSVRIEAHGVYDWRQLNRSEAGDTQLQLGAAGARGCLRLRWKQTEFPTCAGLEAGVFRADAQTSNPPTLYGPWLAPLVSTGVSRRWRSFGIWASATTLVRLLGTQILVGGTPTSRPETVSARLLAGAAIFFP